MTITYSQRFWNSMRGDIINAATITDKLVSTGSYPAPEEFKGRFDKALAKDNVFRRLAIVVNTTSGDGTIHAVASTGTAEWIAEVCPSLRVLTPSPHSRSTPTNWPAVSD